MTGGRADGWIVHLMDGIGRQAMDICHRRTEVDEGGPSTSWTDSDNGPLKILKYGRSWTARQMDEVRPWRPPQSNDFKSYRYSETRYETSIAVSPRYKQVGKLLIVTGL